ncbi:MAG: substrate-binding domain-containing protein [Bryobacteraceae bacterium]|nr:substrate-binding domain-containing protein [Bryobacteraceae bacterium]MDW8376859.1 substrate-binding domain-containing protein [Bryobacterales bacterium]
MLKVKDKRGKKTISALDRGLLILETIQNSVHPLNIQEIAALTGLQRLAVYRCLNTLEQRSYVKRSVDKRYVAMVKSGRPCVAYLAPLTGNRFRDALTGSIREAAAESNCDLLLMNNREDDEETMMANATVLCERKPDVVMFFQPRERLGHRLADFLAQAGLRFLTIERAIPGGIYFGANNFLAGRMAGQVLGQHARQVWGGHFDRVVLLEDVSGRSSLHARMAGMLTGLSEILGHVPESKVEHVYAERQTAASRQAMARILEQLPANARVLVLAFNDLTAVGAAQAVRESGRSGEIAIAGQNASEEGRRELRIPNSPLIATVAYFPERYGMKLLALCRRWLSGQPVPPAEYTDHVVISAENVDRYYPEEGSVFSQSSDLGRGEASSPTAPRNSH